MGEYAKRIADGEEIKIGTCESMYYIRHEDRFKAEEIRNSLNPQTEKNLFWRIPLFSEDGIEPGDYDNYDVKDSKDSRYELRLIEDERFLKLQNDNRTSQARIDESGLVMNVKCYHGLKLNESNDDVKFFFNGKTFPLHLNSLKNAKNELRICIRCYGCGQLWSFPFNEIWDVIGNENMMFRLFEQCVQYWEEHNETPCTYEVAKTNSNDDYIQLHKSNNGFWMVFKNGIALKSIDKKSAFKDAVTVYKRLSTL